VQTRNEVAVINPRTYRVILPTADRAEAADREAPGLTG
jgi:hypothetical protein